MGSGEWGVGSGEWGVGSGGVAGVVQGTPPAEVPFSFANQQSSTTTIVSHPSLLTPSWHSSTACCGAQPELPVAARLDTP